MARTLSLLLTAAAVVAFDVPAFANAATSLTEVGVLVPKGAKLQLIDIGEVAYTPTSWKNFLPDHGVHRRSYVELSCHSRLKRGWRPALRVCA